MRGHSTAEMDIRDAWRLGQSCPHPQTSRVEARGTAPDTLPVPARCLFSFGPPTVNTGQVAGRAGPPAATGPAACGCALGVLRPVIHQAWFPFWDFARQGFVTMSSARIGHRTWLLILTSLHGSLLGMEASKSCRLHFCPQGHCSLGTAGWAC